MAYDYSGSAQRERMQDNLSKAFSLLDDDKPQYQAPSSFYGGNPRIGTAPAGGNSSGYGAPGGIKSNYTGSDFGDSDIGDTTSQMRGRHMNNENQYGVPQLGI